ncbi:hypothetical protein EUTSA_v10019365mg [Eutrema salsugineum]|uniref:Uncharacterized protein n=1 Tax=Eutrema salsugineum TaxID=72664 RepID=V4MBN5_EUTSA|nr:uncharacterized protein LOC18008556 [Eutrema salsugineum]ESQ28601.1 hypothetical protein EUTSA_v10019365mg [Eutrema salsugineum]
MIMKKTTQASLLLSLIFILLCISFQVCVTEARLSRLIADPPSQFLNPPGPPRPMPVVRSPPCGTNIGSQIMARREERCRQIPRLPKIKITKPLAAIP